jgi:hypothetical protein
MKKIMLVVMLIVLTASCFADKKLTDSAEYMHNSTYASILIDAAEELIEHKGQKKYTISHLKTIMDCNLPPKETLLGDIVEEMLSKLSTILINYHPEVFVTIKKGGPKSPESCINKDIQTAKKILDSYIDASRHNRLMLQECGL